VLLTITSTAPDATDLGYLLHKHPDRVQRFDLPVGHAQVFYPEATAERCTVALLLEVDPIGLVRGRRFGGDGFALGQYVNDRPYAASSMLAVALGRVFTTALKGRCESRPDLAATALPLSIRVPAAPSQEGAELVERLFGPLGWDVAARTTPLDPRRLGWGDAPYVDLELRGTHRLAEALSHLYVLLPVLDGAKHYWVGADEVDKLVRSGGAWLGAHPERDLITRRYLAHQRTFVSDAVERLAALDDSAGPSSDVGPPDADATESPRPLALLRRRSVLDALRRVGARRVVDLGCGEGVLLRDLLTDPAFIEILGVDVSARELVKAAKRLDLDRLSDSQRARIAFRQSSATYRDASLEGWDAIVLMEVVEHLDPDRLPALERSVFRDARPGAVVVTTPNADYNPLYPSLPAGAMRHPDHRFEWSRAEFAAWAERVGYSFGYAAELASVGDVDPQRGGPTQLALFTRRKSRPPRPPTARPEGILDDRA
jgi:3' terminal RNA ribose 2'-O-methyltransferase Hen1